MFKKPNPSSGIPIYKQLKDQIRHFIEIGALKEGDQLPSIRALAETLVINPNTIVRIYRELEQEEVIIITHGLGAFIANQKKPDNEKLLKKAQVQLSDLIEKLIKQGLSESEIRRLVEASFMEIKSF